MSGTGRHAFLRRAVSPGIVRAPDASRERPGIRPNDFRRSVLWVLTIPCNTRSSRGSGGWLQPFCQAGSPCTAVWSWRSGWRCAVACWSNVWHSKRSSMAPHTSGRRRRCNRVAVAATSVCADRRRAGGDITLSAQPRCEAGWSSAGGVPPAAGLDQAS